MPDTLAIIGPGNLGCSLARHAAECGLSVRVAGRNLEHVQSAFENKSVKGLTLEHIHLCRSWPEALEGATVLFEALPEALEVKAKAWSELDRLASREVLRLAGSSSLPLSEIRLRSGMSGTLLGFHLFVPVHRMRIVELVLEADSPFDQVLQAQGLGKSLGLRVVPVRDQPGYAASRMALVQALEAIRLLEQGIASAEDIDALMVIGYGHPVGPLELTDRIGLDLRNAIAQQLYQTTNDDRFSPPKLLQDLVSQGRLGRKSGHGFYQWDSEGRRMAVRPNVEKV